MQIIKTEGYSVKDKVVIANDYIVPELTSQYNIAKDQILIEKDVMTYIISRSEEEKGVRNLKRSLNEIFSFVNYRNIIKDYNVDSLSVMMPLKLTTHIVNKILPLPKSQYFHSMYA
jgi:ATP-dependent Lon protease